MFKLMKNDHFKYFLPFGSFPSSFWAIEGVDILHLADIVNFVSLILCPFVFCL